MLKNVIPFIFMLSLLSLSSCKKDSTSTDPPVTVDNYINFTVDQVQVNATFKVLLQDHVFNAYYTQANSIEMQRLVENGNPQRLIFKIDRIELATVTYPLTIQYSTDYSLPTVSVTYVGENNMPFGTNTNNGQDFTLTINSYDNNVINGIFSGTLYSGVPATPTIVVADGELNLELVEY
ncbi:MAG: hypothetical protein ACI85Q_000636 [Salibacteraceae bacterium]|jgi:hypothetical protein